MLSSRIVIFHFFGKFPLLNILLPICQGSKPTIPFFKETFDCIYQIMQDHKVPYCLIGVNAIALELLKKRIKPTRGTKDIDFAIMISNMADYEAISKDLEKQGFNKVKAPWTFYSDRYKVAIDLLPFGEIEEQDTENFHKRNADLHILGLREVLGEAEQIQIGDKIANIHLYQE